MLHGSKIICRCAYNFPILIIKVYFLVAKLNSFDYIDKIDAQSDQLLLNYIDITE